MLASAQFRGAGDRSINIELMNGFIYKHKKTIAQLITSHPQGLRISMNRKSLGKKQWEQRYNYPDVGLSFIYLDYKNPAIGKSLALIPHYNIYLTKNRQAKSQWKYQIGLGLEYNTNKYNKVTNNQNNVLGTSFNFGISLQFQNQLELSQRLKLINAISLTHFSNGSIKKPNSGINTISFNTGLSYVFQSEGEDFMVSEDPPVDRKGLGYTATVSFGLHEATKIRSGSYPFFVVSAFTDKTLNHKSKIGLGIEWFYSASLKNEIPYNYKLDGATPDFNRIGIALSHELCLGKFSVITQMGYYVYDPYKPFAPFYVRVGLRRYFNHKLYASLCVKSHYAKAEAAEFAIGWRFR